MDAQTAFAIGFLGMTVAMIIVFAIALYVIYIIAFWRIFTKAGVPGWKSIIPFYNLYMQFKITWKTSFFWVFLALLFAAGIVQGIGGNHPSSAITIIRSVLQVLAGIVIMLDCYFLSISFGHGLGFTIGIWFLEFIFTLILAFGSSQYEGNGYLLYQYQRGK